MPSWDDHEELLTDEETEVVRSVRPTRVSDADLDVVLELDEWKDALLGGLMIGAVCGLVVGCLIALGAVWLT